MANDINGLSGYAGTGGYNNISNGSVNTGNQSAFGSTVTQTNQGNYLGNLQNHPSYSSLAGQNIAPQANVQSQIPTPYYGAAGALGYSGTSVHSDYQTQGAYFGAAPYTPSTASTPEAGEKTRKLHGGGAKVTLVLYKEGVVGYAKAKYNQQTPYTLLTTVDAEVSFKQGVAKAVGEDAGAHYRDECLKHKDQLVVHVLPFSYEFRASQGSASKLSKGGCKKIYSLIPPYRRHNKDPHSMEALTNAFASILATHGSSESNNLPILSCFVGAGSAGWTGTDLAQALNQAYIRLQEIIPTFADRPKLTLVGRTTPEDQKVFDEFAKEWGNLVLKQAKKSDRKLKKVNPQKPDGQFVSNSPLPVRSSAPQVSTTLAATGGVKGCTHQETLIPGKLEIVIHPNDGMFGVAKELPKTMEGYDLVNAANDQMKHGGGIACEFAKKFSGFSEATYNALKDLKEKSQSENPIKPGDCLSINLNDCNVSPPDGLEGCKRIHNVVAPKKHKRVLSTQEQRAFDKAFKEAFISLLTNAACKGCKQVVSCFIGCGIYGANGTDMARALHAAYRSNRIQKLSLKFTIPQLVLAGRGTGADKAVYDDFIEEFKRREKSSKPVTLFSGRSSSPAGYASGISGTGYRTKSDTKPKQRLSAVGIKDENITTLASPAQFRLNAGNVGIVSEAREVRRLRKLSLSTPQHALSGAVEKHQHLFGTEPASPVVTKEKSKIGESGAAAFTGGGKNIDCGICGESTSKVKIKTVKGLQVCSSCQSAYDKSGHNLEKFEKLDEEFAAIKYSPLQVRTETQDLPGHPGAGRIVVTIKATVPDTLNERQIAVTSKVHNHYLPNNEIGQELLRLLRILHKEKILFKIDKSHTLAQFGLTFNFHLKTADFGGVASHGYPDPGYPGRALENILGLATTHGLQDELNTETLFELIEAERQKTER